MIDVPEFTGRQMVWTVFNDANNPLHAVLGATAPMGIEVRCLYSAFKLRGPLDSAIVIRWTIINRSDADYRDVYPGLWSDVDLGDANDDLPGVTQPSIWVLYTTEIVWTGANSTERHPTDTTRSLLPLGFSCFKAPRSWAPPMTPPDSVPPGGPASRISAPLP